MLPPEELFSPDILVLVLHSMWKGPPSLQMHQTGCEARDAFPLTETRPVSKDASVDQLL